MADDDDPVTTSSPWGRSRRIAGQPTPAPGPPPTTQTPVAQWAAPPTSPPGPGPGGYGGAPPPGYPPGGYPPGSHPAARKGSGAAVALVAVGVIALLLVGAAVALVALSGGDDEDPDRAAGDATTVTTEAPSTTESPATELPGSSTTEAPATTDAPATTGPVPTPSLPESGSLAPPEDFPDPPGATESITGGIEVPGMTAAEVGAFYEAELPGAGYTVDRVDDVGGIIAISVSGPARGVLSVTTFEPLPTTVVWSTF